MVTFANCTITKAKGTPLSRMPDLKATWYCCLNLSSYEITQQFHCKTRGVNILFENLYKSEKVRFYFWVRFVEKFKCSHQF